MARAAPSLALVATLAALLAPSAASAGRATPGSLQVFDTAVDAFQSLLLDKPPRVIALGEFHEVAGGPAVRSSLVHFREELLPLLAPVSTDLILETWVTRGDCGETEKEVVSQVEQTTQRPESTESELVTLIKQARKNGVEPHILEMSCREYRALLDRHGEMDYVALLATIARMLEKQIDAALAQHPKSAGDKAVLVYGGAVHNELQPRPGLGRFTYAPSVQRKTRGRLLSVDLFVPEYLARSDDMKAQPWYRLLARVPRGKTALIRRGPASYLLVFARSDEPPGESAHPPPASPAAPQPPRH